MTNEIDDLKKRIVQALRRNPIIYDDREGLKKLIVEQLKEALPKPEVLTADEHGVTFSMPIYGGVDRNDSRK